MKKIYIGTFVFLAISCILVFYISIFHFLIPGPKEEICQFNQEAIAQASPGALLLLKNGNLLLLGSNCFDDEGRVTFVEKYGGPEKKKTPEELSQKVVLVIYWDSPKYHKYLRKFELQGIEY